MSQDILECLRDRPLLCDGAMGTMIYGKGIPFERCFDELNLSEPALIADIHRGYIEAGSTVIQANTFGANRYKLGEYGLADRVTEINQAGVKLARRVIEAAFRPVFLAASVGPLGQKLAPLGRLSVEAARLAYREQVTALVEAEIDLLIFDTFTDLLELREAILVAREVAPELPISAQVTFNREGRTPLGHTAQTVAEQLTDLPIDIVGVNCSVGPAGILDSLQALHQYLPADMPLSAQPNAGWPTHLGGRIMYPATPEYFGDYALAFIEAGARLIGGCCGTTPQHITQMRQALDDPNRKALDFAELPGQEVGGRKDVEVVGPTRLAQKLDRGEFVVTVEMSPPKGVSVEKVVAGAETLQAAGATAINVADSPRSRMRMSPWAVCHQLQTRLNIETVLHFPTRGRNILRVQGDLLAAHALNVRNIFVVMGDPTSIGDYPEAMNDYDVVPSGLIKLLQQGLNQGLDYGGETISQPTDFLVGCALNLTPADPEREIKVLRRKLENGANFALTQPIYDVAAAQSFLSRYQDEHGPLKLPLLAGVLPLFNARHAEFLHNEVPGINIPDDIRQRMHQAGEKGAEAGVKMAQELVLQLRDTFAQGVYLMPPFGRYNLAAEVIEVLQAEPVPA